MKKLFLFITFSTLIFGKNFTLSVGAENSGAFKSNYTTDSNPRIDVEFLNHENRLGFGMGTGINYINIDKQNYLLTTNISLNSSLNIINNELYQVYLGVNVGYAYPFVTVYHVENDLYFMKTNFYYEFKVGTYYNDFNINIGLSNLYLKKSVNNILTKDSVYRLSINAGFLLF